MSADNGKDPFDPFGTEELTPVERPMAEPGQPPRRPSSHPRSLSEANEEIKMATLRALGEQIAAVEKRFDQVCGFLESIIVRLERIEAKQGIATEEGR